MSHPFSVREQKILEILQKQKSVSIQQLIDEFGVSNMTIHRDLNKMAESGHLHKTHGGATLAVQAVHAHAYSCAMCHKTSSGRTMFILQLENGEKKLACCAHCGLMLQSETKKVKQSLTVDYLHGHMVNADQAAYVLESDLNICCIPSVLSFGTRQDAEKFKKGFGGRIATLEQAIQFLHG